MKKLKPINIYTVIAGGIAASIGSFIAIKLSNRIEALEDWEALLIGLFVFLIAFPVLKLMQFFQNSNSK